jgi:hypothetical protein
MMIRASSNHRAGRHHRRDWVRMERLMTIEDMTLGLFAVCNGLRVFAYFPQIVAAATDRNGATAISCTTWWLFLLANLSTIAYAVVNQSDWRLAACFMANAACCIAILAVTYCKRREATLRTAGAAQAAANTISESTRQALPC